VNVKKGGSRWFPSVHNTSAPSPQDACINLVLVADEKDYPNFVMAHRREGDESGNPVPKQLRMCRGVFVGGEGNGLRGKSVVGQTSAMLIFVHVVRLQVIVGSEVKVVSGVGKG